MSEPQTVLTVGHSTRSIEDFVALLQAQRVSHLVDVRKIPRSRHNPQFNRDTLPKALAPIAYTHMPELGGLRHALKNSPNTGWRNLSFRGFADYMQTAEFAQALQKLIGIAVHDRVAIVCGEAVPWRCHRSLIADALIARGIAVGDIITGSLAQPHKITPFAKVDGTRVTYPAPLA